MAARRRRVDRGKIIGIVIMVIALVLVVAFLLYSLYLWFKVHKIPVNYFVFSLIISIAWAIPLIIFTISLTKHLRQVPPLPKKRIIAGLGFLALLFIIIIVLFLYIFPTATILLIINIVNATLVEYKLLYCCKVCGGVPLNQAVLNPVGSNETMFARVTLSQSFIVLVLGGILLAIVTILWLLTIPLLKVLLEFNSGGREGTCNTLCYGDRWLFYSYMAMTLITYFMGFGIIVYSLAILSSSEFPYAYAMLITTFLVLIVEALMTRNSGAGSLWPWVVLFISVVSSLLYTVVTFYINGFILPSACLTSVNDMLDMYVSSLLLAGTFGIIPYVSTLSVIHYRIMCPRVETEKTR